jgi:hypothetical protein
MQNSVALLMAARAELVSHDDRDAIVTNLCRIFAIGREDASAALVAAELLAEQPGPSDPLPVGTEMSHQQ